MLATAVYGAHPMLSLITWSTPAQLQELAAPEAVKQASRCL